MWRGWRSGFGLKEGLSRLKARQRGHFTDSAPLSAPVSILNNNRAQAQQRIS